jgi:hypothetical protein
VVDTVRTLDGTAAREVEAAVLPVPEHISDPALAAFRRKLRKAGIAADPRSAAEKAARAAEDHDVWVTPQDNGMAYVGAPGRRGITGCGRRSTSASHSPRCWAWMNNLAR